MLQRVPGVQEILNRNRQQRNSGGGASSRGSRGFGSGGDQILIDGKRLAGKSNNIDDTLGRISAEQVERIELIRGASSALDVQSQGLVVNIILKEGASNSSTFVQLKSEVKGDNDPGFEALISHSGAISSLDYTLSAARTNNNSFLYT
jgi:outer membrane receptor for ferrienterochelin and colicin